MRGDGHASLSVYLLDGSFCRLFPADGVLDANGKQVITWRHDFFANQYCWTIPDEPGKAAANLCDPDVVVGSQGDHVQPLTTGFQNGVPRRQKSPRQRKTVNVKVGREDDVITH